ncbi:Uncharacterised protein [Candidatus Norongarragalina meridionalis]|nr:Uncharacterised protein [Candidatus Norongarragalina meridionalis]
MKKASIFALLLLALPLCACDFLDVSLLDSAEVTQGAVAVYPITLTNTGLNDMLAKLSGDCPAGLVCTLQPSPAWATLYPTQSKTFTLLVDTAGATPGNYAVPIDITMGASTLACDHREMQLAVKPVTESEVPPFNVSISSNANVTGLPGQEVEFSVTISNNRDGVAYASLELVGPFSETTRFAASTITLQPKQTKEVRVTLLIPPGTPGSVYQNAVLVKALGPECCEKQYEFPLQVCVFGPPLQLVLQNEPIYCIPVQHGNSTTWELMVRNDGDIEGPFNIEVDGHSDMVSVSPTLLEVAKGDRQPVTLTINAPTTAILDTYYYSLKVKYLDWTVFLKPYCFEVQAKVDFEVEKDNSYTVARCVMQSIPLKVRNTGSIAEGYEIEVSPPYGMLVVPTPRSFSLGPGESKDVALVITTSLYKTPLGPNHIPIVIRTSRIAKAFDIPITLVSSNRTGESYLSIIPKPLSAAPGVQSSDTISVANTKNMTLFETALTIEGIPSAWYSVSPNPQNIDPKKTVSYGIVFAPPAEAKPGKYAVNITAAALGGESVKVATLFSLEAQPPSMAMAVSDAGYYGSDEAKQIVVSVTVRNTGGTALSSVRPALSGLQFASNPQAVDLKPGESKTMIVTVSGVDSTRAPYIPLAVQSADGTQSNAVNLPTKKTVIAQAGGVPWLVYAVVALVILLFGLAFYARKEQKEELARAEAAGGEAKFAEEQPSQPFEEEPKGQHVLPEYEAEEAPEFEADELAIREPPLPRGKKKRVVKKITKKRVVAKKKKKR